MMYFSEALDAEPSDDPQLARLREFRDSLSARAFFCTYTGLGNLAALVHDHLAKETMAILRARRTAAEATPEFSGIVTELYPEVQALVRFADDLVTGIARHMGRSPPGAPGAVASSIHLRDIVLDYNAIAEHFCRMRPAFYAQLVNRLEPVAEDIRDAARHCLESTLRFKERYDVPAPAEGMEMEEHHGRATLAWGDEHLHLVRLVENARAALGDLDQVLIDYSKQQCQHSNSRDASVRERARELLHAYWSAVESVAHVVNDFADGAIDDAVQATSLAGTLVPPIRRLNEAYVALSKQSLELRMSMVRGTSDGRRVPHLFRALGDMESYHWDELRPDLNGFLTNIALVYGGDTSAWRISVLHKGRDEWRKLSARLLANSKRGLDGLRADASRVY